MKVNLEPQQALRSWNKRRYNSIKKIIMDHESSSLLTPVSKIIDQTSFTQDLKNSIQFEQTLIPDHIIKSYKQKSIHQSQDWKPPLIDPISLKSQRMIIKKLMNLKIEQLPKSSVLNLNLFQLPTLGPQKAMSEISSGTFKPRFPQCSTFYKIKQSRLQKSFFSAPSIQSPQFIYHSNRYLVTIPENEFQNHAQEEQSQIEISTTLKVTQPLTDTHLRIQTFGTPTEYKPKKLLPRSQIVSDNQIKSTKRILILNMVKKAPSMLNDKSNMTDPDDDFDLGQYLKSLQKI